MMGYFRPVPAHRVVTVVQDGGLLLDLAMPVHVFDYHGGGRYRHTLVGAGGRTVRTCTGVRLATQGGLRLLEQADTIVILGYEDVYRRPGDALLRALRAAAGRGVRLVSICTGAFTLAWAAVGRPGTATAVATWPPRGRRRAVHHRPAPTTTMPSAARDAPAAAAARAPTPTVSRIRCRGVARREEPGRGGGEATVVDTAHRATQG